MGNIECILATVNNLSDSDLKILANLIMDRLNPEKAFASPVKIVPRMECPVCHTSAHVVRGRQAAVLRQLIKQLCCPIRTGLVAVSNK